MISRVGRISSVLALSLVASSALAQKVSPPSTKDSVQFLAIGDSGTGDRAQYEVAGQLAKARASFPFTFAIMMGDNIYGSERPQDYQKKFEIPSSITRSILPAAVTDPRWICARSSSRSS